MEAVDGQVADLGVDHAAIGAAWAPAVVPSCGWLVFSTVRVEPDAFLGRGAEIVCVHVLLTHGGEGAVCCSVSRVTCGNRKMLTFVYPDFGR